MAVVVYQCDTCKRELHRKQNRTGLDVVSHCVITNGCRGKLLMTAVKPSYAIGHTAPPVLGLDDWAARKVLHTHKQVYLKKVWEVNHNLNNQPSVSAFVYKGDNLVRANDAVVAYTSNDTLTITFPTAVLGTAQCQARSASDGQNITTMRPVTATDPDATSFSLSRAAPFTNGMAPGELTIAARVSTVAISGFAPTMPITMHAHFLSPTDLSEITTVPVTLTFRTVSNTPVDTAASPWADVTYTSIRGHRYLVRSANIHFGDPQNLTDRGIPEGAPCYFTVTYNGAARALANDEIYVLGSAAPHQPSDIDLSTTIDLSTITAANASASLVYTNYELVVNTALLKTIFPSILIL